MVPPQLMERIVAEVTSHARASKGYEEESFINPLTPVDSVAAFAMAKVLTEQNAFDVWSSPLKVGAQMSVLRNTRGAMQMNSKKESEKFTRPDGDGEILQAVGRKALALELRNSRWLSLFILRLVSYPGGGSFAQR